MASCCQLAFHCKHFPCEACQKVDFEIYEGNTDIVVGKMHKTGKGCCVNMLDLGYNNFKLTFPNTKNWKNKVRLRSPRLS